MAHILVVDDDHAVAKVVGMVLTQAGHTISVADSVGAALDALNGGEFGGAIIDVWLGEDDGLDLASALSTKAWAVPFMVMSGGGPGRSLETVTGRADALGAVAVLYKPFDDDELLDAVDTMLGAGKAS